MSRLLPLLLFFGIAILLVGGAHYYTWARMVRDPQLPVTLARVLSVAIALLGAALIAAPIASRLVPRDSMRPVIFFAFVWMGTGFLLVTLLGLTDLGRVLASAGLRLASLISGSPVAPADPARRLFLTRALAGGVGVGALGLAAMGMRSALAGIQVKEVPVRVPRLPEALRGLRIVQISDVHIGALLRKEWLQAVVSRIQSLAPDLIAITGDLVDGTVGELAAQVAPLGQLSAPRGVFFVTGNHEYYSGADSWLQHLPTLGIRPLQNERVKLAPGLEIAGINDLSAHGSSAPDLDRALRGRDPDGALILLAHQPKQFLEAATKDVQLTLSGHTHGGQIWPFSWVVALVQPYVAGLHRRGESQLYVSRGTGFWGPPIRVGAPPEITLLKLEPA